jgi:hypothetical protein
MLSNLRKQLHNIFQRQIIYFIYSKHLCKAGLEQLRKAQIDTISINHQNVQHTFSDYISTNGFSRLWQETMGTQLNYMTKLKFYWKMVELQKLEEDLYL